ncbi:hypothetical protein JL100_015195 [Skermanella mucosa]|uniref:hypothetical protein n=1 Tax=Skermanella mucosa TaxID=1789672 RepID=UPI00192AF32D|nr:hypothetical protein [Skermanella mucosa]UEM18466.1 hypothetical protein JL100_015195 [Skermanella mucosa]
MHHVFRDHALVRLGSDVFLAVLGWPPSLEAFDRWMADTHPGARVGITEFDHLTFGPLAGIVFDHYDVILSVRFASEAEAREFEARWPTIGPAARPFAELWPDPGPTPRRYELYEPHFRRRRADWKLRRAARGEAADPGEPGPDPSPGS